jgi:hypothetical protein
VKRLLLSGFLGEMRAAIMLKQKLEVRSTAGVDRS